MIVIPTTAQIICIVGLIIWFIATRAQTASAFFAEVGRICFAVGLLAALFMK